MHNLGSRSTLNRKVADWANLAEVVSGVAIVVTLVFLIVEIRQNTDAIQSANRQSLAARGENHMLARVDSPELARVVEKTGRGEELSVSERWIYRGYLGAVSRLTEESFLLFEDGRLERRYWNRNAQAFLAYMATPAARDTFAYWASLGTYTPEFSEWAERSLTETYGDAGIVQPLYNQSTPRNPDGPDGDLR